ncbi:MAG TPA: 6-pyruvoyl-tetrahydropterin synthase-related protein [Candidatus Saccharimonadales bacterium]|nr:6-pyruvoyl-tetrahydropterin synthase-related protein [Candidatus Saccharimonadales bacterium]
MVRKNSLLVILLFVILLPAVLGLFHSGFPVTDDGNWMVIRFAAFFTALRHGQFPVRFLLQLNHGYGYPVADFLYPLFMYLGVPIHIAGIGFINTIKIILGGSLLLSGVFCFFWLRKLFSILAAFVGAVCYVLFPYHLFDVYQRGSVGEVVALTIVPFIFWQIERRSLLYISIGIASLILAHNTLALLFLPIIVIYIFLKKVFSIKYIIASVGLGLGLVAFFWIPALYDKQFTIFDSTSVSDYTQYFLTTKNFGIVGLFTLMVGILGVGYTFKKNWKNDLFFLVLIYIGLFFSLPISSFLWNLLPLPQLVQFPFRFLSIAILGTAFFIAYMINTMKTSLKFIIAFLSIFLIYVAAWQYLSPKNYQTYPDSYYATNQDTTTVKNEYMPKWVKQIPLSTPQRMVEVVTGNAVISNIVSNYGNKLQFTVHVPKQSTLRVNIIYFPGWDIFINNKEYAFTYNNPQGVMEVSLSPGDYIVTARFGETQVRAISDFVSLVGLCMIIVLAIKSFKKRN